MIIQLILFFWISLLVLFCFINIKVGCALYLVYLLLVPYMQIRVGLNFSYNLVNAFFLVGFLWNFKQNLRELKFRPFYPFIFYFLSLLLMMPFQQGVPFPIMVDYWFRTAFCCLVFPLILWNVMLRYPNAVDLFTVIVKICIVIVVVYGLFVISHKGVNPYLMLMAEANGVKLNTYYLQGGRLFGRVSSVFPHPMTYGVFLGASLTYILFSMDKRTRLQNTMIVVFLTINIFLCGVRSVVGGIIVAAFFHLIRARKISKVLYLAFFLSIAMPIINLVPNLDNYLGSIFDVKASSRDVGGSSYEMRFNQLDGALYEIKNCALVGKGYAWNFYYQKLHGDHPILLAFESLVFMVLCNNGFIGVAIWIVFLYFLFKTAFRYGENRSLWIETLIVFYVAYSCITGEYEYMKLIAIFYTIMLADARRQNENRILA